MIRTLVTITAEHADADDAQHNYRVLERFVDAAVDLEPGEGDWDGPTFLYQIKLPLNVEQAMDRVELILECESTLRPSSWTLEGEEIELL